MPPEIKRAFAGDGVGMAALVISMALLQLVQVCCAISFRRAIAGGAHTNDEEDQGLTTEKKDQKFNVTLGKLSKM
jgi:UDP-galactopyranose mutase